MATAASAAASNSSKTRFMVQSLYRALLRAAAPFQNDFVANCLLHRNGYFDDADEDDDEPNMERVYIQHCLNRVMDGVPRPQTASEWNSISKDWTDTTTKFPRQYRFPVHLKHQSSLKEIIRQEFKNNEFPVPMTDVERQRVAFWSLRRLTQKLSWYYDLKQWQSDDLKEEEEEEIIMTTSCPPKKESPALQNVVPLNINDPSDYLKPGTFLIAHPNLYEYFGRSVIYILDHHNNATTTTTTTTTTSTSSDDDHSPEEFVEGEDEEDAAPTYGTYGLVINSWVTLDYYSFCTLNDTFRNLPVEFRRVFGSCPIRKGGPVSGTLQMIHAIPPTPDYLEHVEQLGGIPLPRMKNPNDNNDRDDDHPAMFYKTDIMAAAKAVEQGHLTLDQVSLFAGACTWSPGQLQSEVERGTWLPCRAPPHYIPQAISLPSSPSDEWENRQTMWRDMLASCGPEEAELADLMVHDKGWSDYTGPLDGVEDDEV